MKRRIGMLVGGCFLGWLVAVLPARLLWDDRAVIFSATAAVLCLIPAVATLAWAGWAAGQSPEQQVVVALGGTGLRMAFVLGAALLLYAWVPFYGHQAFWFWILAFYLLTLALEIGLLVTGWRVAAGRQGPAASAPGQGQEGVR